LVIDERVREASGAIGLVHSTYYGNDAVIEGVGRFLLSGAQPSKPFISALVPINAQTTIGPSEDAASDFQAT
jgi:hypothetical protein